MCAVRPVKGAGAEPWDNRPWGEKPGGARCTPKEQSVQREARRARDPAPEGAGRNTSLVHQRCAAAAT